jgi:rubrerythrin
MVFVLLAGVSVLAWRAWSRIRRAAGVLCPVCGYSLSGLSAGALCPECGGRRAT